MKKFIFIIIAFLFVTSCVSMRKQPDSMQQLIEDMKAAEAAGAKWSTYGDLGSGTVADADTFLILDQTASIQKQYKWSDFKTDISSFSVLEIPNDTSTDASLSNQGEIHMRGDEDRISFHFGSSGDISGEATLSWIQHVSVVFDPAWAYDQEDTYRIVQLFNLMGPDLPNGLTIVEWRTSFVSATRTTNLDMDLMCDTDLNPTGGTVMDVLDILSSNQASTATSGFDSATCTSNWMYLRFGADPTDANELLSVEIYFYAEED
jgi:hypothetical protein